MQSNASANVSGYVERLEDGSRIDGRELTMEWLLAQHTEVIVRKVAVGEDGSFGVEGLDAEVVYLVRINGILGIPANIVPEEGDNKAVIKWSETLLNVGLSGEVLAYDGTTQLGGVQKFGLWDIAANDWGWATTPTQDMGTRQDLPSGCSVQSGRTYAVYVNYGPGFYYDTVPNPAVWTADVWVPMSGLSGAKFKRNSGTALVHVNNAPQNGDWMHWKSGAAQITAPDFRVYSPGAASVLVSAVGGTTYTVRIKPGGGGSFAQAAAPNPYTLPSRSGAGSDAVTFTK